MQSCLLSVTSWAVSQLRPTLRMKAGSQLVALITLGFALSLFGPDAWKSASEDASATLYTRVRGERALDDRLLFVDISTEDIRDLGGWPITRDYYGYFLYALSSHQPRLVVFDILMEQPRPDYPEYDRLFADYLETSTPVVLPMAFARFTPPLHSQRYFAGEDPGWPHPALLERVSGCGFSNVPASSTLSRLPLVAMDRDSLRLSLAAEIARRYWGGHPFNLEPGLLVFEDDAGKRISIALDAKGQLRLNHFGGRRLQRLGFVAALQQLREHPENLDLKNRIIFVGVTAPGVAVSKTTALNPVLPAALLQLTAVDNLLRGNELDPLPLWLQVLLLVFFCRSLVFCLQRLSAFHGSLIFIAALLLSVLLGQVLFQWHWIWPLFAPLAAMVISGSVLLISKVWLQRAKSEELHAFLQEEIRVKAAALQEAQRQLDSLQARLLHDTSSADDLALQRLLEKERAVAEMKSRLEDLQAALQPGSQRQESKYDIVYSSNSPMADVLQTIELLSPSDISVIIEGETGTGKEMVARAIHRAGKRSAAPFLAVNCGALAETLLESELFGHEKGSFTGAVARRRGLFELADKGTLFLDEISETSPAFQAKLLRVLQEKVLQRLGGEMLIHVDVRIIAATNRDLKQLVEEGKFRMDLFYRLNGMTIALPALRERAMDIPVLARHFLTDIDPERPFNLSEEALLVLMEYAWPGNIRELDNVLRRAVLLARGRYSDLIAKEDLPANMLTKRSDASVYLSLEEQILHSLRALDFSHKAIAQTALALGRRDRGTITEYFRGLCFEYLVAEKYSVQDAACALAGTGKSETVMRVRKKLQAYVDNLKAHATASVSLPYKGLPRKYHAALQLVIQHLDEIR